MRSVTLVRTVGPCVKKTCMVIIKMQCQQQEHEVLVPRIREACLAGHQVSERSKRLSGLSIVIPVRYSSSIDVQAERECRHCTYIARIAAASI